MVICKGWILGLNLKKPKPRLAAFCGIITHMLTNTPVPETHTSPGYIEGRGHLMLMSDGSISEYTREELWEILKPAYEDEAAGRMYTMEEVQASFRKKIQHDLQDTLPSPSPARFD